MVLFESLRKMPMNTDMKPIGHYEEQATGIRAEECLDILKNAEKSGEFLACKVTGYSETKKQLLIAYGCIRGVIEKAYITKTFHLPLEYLIGKTTKVRIRDVDTEKAVFEASRIEVENAAEELLASYQVGDVVEGVVKEIRDDLACSFIELAEGITAYLSLQEITTMPNTMVEVSSFLKVGERIEGQIIYVPPLKNMKHLNQRIKLSCLAMEESFEESCKKYEIDSYFSGIPCEDRMINDLYYISINRHTYIRFETKAKLDKKQPVKVRITSYNLEENYICATYDDEAMLQREEEEENKIPYVSESVGSMYVSEVKSNVSPFAVRKNEDKHYESACEPIGINRILSKYKDGIFTETHTNILRIIDKLGYCTSKQIISYAYSNRIPMVISSRDKLTNKLKSLEKCGLIEVGKFQSKEQTGIFRIFCISKNGKHLLQNYFKDNKRKTHYLNMREDNFVWIKRILSANQYALASMEKLTAAYTYHLQEVLRCRDKIGIKPTSVMEYDKSVVFLESVRRGKLWQTDLLDKAKRYEVLLNDIESFGMRKANNPEWIKQYKCPHIVIICEDEEHVIECNEVLKETLLFEKVFYTYDLQIFRNDFEFSIYRIDQYTQKKHFYSVPDLFLENSECYTSSEVKKNNISDCLFNRVPEVWIQQMLLNEKSFRAEGVKTEDKHQNLELLRRGQYEEFITSSRLSRNKEESEVLWEPRIFFFGNGGAGKTSIIKLLAGEPFNLDEPKTNGVQVHPNLWKHLSWMKQGEKKIGHINVWDFAGQECDHALTSFLITDAALCIIVVDSRSEDYPDEWLNYIKMYAPRAKVLLVLNKIDSQNEVFHDEKRLYYNRLNIPMYLKEYPNIAGVYNVSCKEPNMKGCELEKLKADICSQVLEMREQFENTWVKGINELKDWMREHTEGCIRKKEFIRKHDELGLADKVDAEKTLNLCIQAGLCIHHRKMKSYIVLKPQWITSALAKLLRNRQFKERKWQLSEEEIVEVIESSDRDHFYQYQRGDGLEVLDLMQTLNICVQHQDEYFFPCFLPYIADSKSVESILDESDWYELELRYRCLLPNIFTELQAKLWEYRLDHPQYEPDKSKIVFKMNNRRMMAYKKHSSIFLAVEKKNGKLCEEEKQAINFARMKLDEINKNHGIAKNSSDKIQECVVLKGTSNDLSRQMLRLSYPKAYIKKMYMMGIKEQYFPEVDRWYELDNLLTEEYTEEAIKELYESYVVSILSLPGVADDMEQRMFGNGMLLPYRGKWYIICCAHQIVDRKEDLYARTVSGEYIPIRLVMWKHDEKKYNPNDVAVFEMMEEDIEHMQVLPKDIMPFSTRIAKEDSLFCKSYLQSGAMESVHGITLTESRNGFLLCDIKDENSQIRKGMSGTPVLNLANRHLVGMIRTKGNADSKVAGIISMDAILKYLEEKTK